MIKIMAFGEPDEVAKRFILDSLHNDHVARYLYSYIDNCDLNRLATLQPNQMTADEKEIWRRGRRLLGLKAGDYILHKNVPVRGKVTAARICSEYFYDANPKPMNSAGRQDGRHCFRVDKIFEFSRDAVHPQLQIKLKVMGALYAISDVKEFYESMRNLGMPFDESDRVAAAESGVILSDSVTDSCSNVTPPIKSVPPSIESPLEKISAIRENYLNELLKVLRTLPPDDPSRNEVIENILDTLRMFSSDALKKIVRELFIKNDHRLIGDESDLVFEPFSKRELMHDLYKPADEPKKIFVHIKTDSEPCDALTNSDGNINILIDLSAKSAAPQVSDVIRIDGATFADVLARHGIC